jgi:triacylglycerol lipase
MRTIPYSAAKADLFTPYVHDKYFTDNEARTTAGLCAELSRLAYARTRKPLSRTFDQQLIGSVLASVGFSGCQFFESTGTTGGTHCFTATGKDQQSGKQVGLVVFRGTDADDPMDIGDDADFLLTAWKPGGNVHTGFFNALNGVEPALGVAIKAMSHPILFTGHSLGAAIATLAASFYRSSIANDSALYTFGCPRVGDAKFTATLAGMAGRRYVDCTDIVTRVPLEKMGYAHVGEPYYINRRGEITLNPSEFTMKEDQALGALDYLFEYAWRPGDVGVRDLADHIPMNYVFAVRAAAELSSAVGA